MSRASAYIETSRHNVFYFRVRVPVAARAAIASTHIRRSLKTKSRREAVIRAAELLAKVEPMFEAAQRGDVVNLQTLSWCPIRGSNQQTLVNEPVEPCLKLSQVWDGYRLEQEREGVRRKTIEDKNAQVSLLIRILGDIPIRNVDRESAKHFKEVALQLPPRINHLPNQPLKRIIANANTTISTTTFNNYVKNLTTLFVYAKREGYCLSNPFEGLRIKQRVKANRLRSAFSEQELSLLVASLPNTHKNQKLAYRYWLPYLALYTGGRLNELSQLYLDDFVTVNGIECIHIQDARADQRLKNQHSERLIPIHSKLREQGLLEYVDKLRASGQERLFPELMWSELHGYAIAPSRWFARYVSSLGLRGDGVRKDFHSFRHTVADHLKQKGVSESLVGGLLGHSTGGITFTRYGKDYEPENIVPIVEQLGFELNDA